MYLPNTDFMIIMKGESMYNCTSLYNRTKAKNKSCVFDL